MTRLASMKTSFPLYWLPGISILKKKVGADKVSCTTIYILVLEQASRLAGRGVKFVYPMCTGYLGHVFKKRAH